MSSAPSGPWKQSVPSSEMGSRPITFLNFGYAIPTHRWTDSATWWLIGSDFHHQIRTLPPAAVMLVQFGLSKWFDWQGSSVAEAPLGSACIVFRVRDLSYQLPRAAGGKKNGLSFARVADP